MKITILIEDTAEPGSGLGAEHGFSAFVEFGGKKILFDTGQSGAFTENAERLGIDLNKTDFVVLSHGHFDHTGGLPAFLEKFDTEKMAFVSHPGIFEKKLHGSQWDIGCPLTRDEIVDAFKDCIFTDKPFEFIPGATFLGDVPRSYEDPGTCCDHVVGGAEEPDLVRDDSAIAFKTDKGIVLLTGCSHSGILNLAKESEEMGRLYAIIGGFHLMGASRERLDRIISEFHKMGIKELRPGHCTGSEAIERMERELGAKRITTGEAINI